MDVLKEKINKLDKKIKETEELLDNPERLTMYQKIENLIEKYGEYTSEGEIYWNDKITYYNDKKHKWITINKNPLDAFIEEIYNLFN